MSYEWDTSCADLELRRLQDGFTSYDFVNFARVLLLGYERVANDVHIETGRLRESINAYVEESRPERWVGEISAGGGTVRWAASEFFGYSERHGGYPSHSYFRSLGWQPQPRLGGLDEDGGVPWAQNPIGAVGDTGVGVPIDEDMLGPVTSFLSRGQRTPHPERGGV